MTRLEKILLAILIMEMPLQIDKYLMYHESHALQGSVGGINISIATFCLAGLYALWGSEIVRHRARSAGDLTLGIPALAYLAAMCLSIVAAPLPQLAVFDVIIVVQAFLLYFYVANRLSSEKDVQLVLGAIALGLIIGSVPIIASVFLQRYFHFDELVFGPLTVIIWPDGRPGGTMHSPVLAGSFLALLAAPVSGVLITPTSRWSKALAMVALLLGFLAVTMTQTRGAVITVVLAGLIMGFACFRRGWLPAWTPAAVLALCLVSAWPMWIMIQKRVASGDEGSAIARKHLSLIAWEAIQDRPILGGGAGNCHLICANYANHGRFRSEWYYTIHCKFLLVWVETGLVGLLTYLWFLGDALVRSWCVWRSKIMQFAPVGLALLAGILGHMTHMLVDIFNSRAQVHELWLCAGLAAALLRLARIERPAHDVNRVQWLLHVAPPRRPPQHAH